MKTNMGRFVLVLFFLVMCWEGPAYGQQIFQSSLDLDGAETFYDILVLPDGDLMLCGVHDGQLLMVRSTPMGDTVWTKTYPDIAGSLDLQLTIDGMVSIRVGYPGRGIHVLDPFNGEELNFLDVSLLSYCWSAVDSLTYTRNDTLIHSHLDGTIAWQRSFGLPDQELFLDQVIRTANHRYVTWGRIRTELSNVSTQRLWLGVHSANGVLIDSVGIDSPLWTNCHELKLTPSGGFLALGHIGSALPIWLVGDADGNIISENGFADIDQGNLGMAYYGILFMTQRPDGSFICMGDAGIEPFLENDRTVVEMDSNLTVTCHYVLPSDSSTRDFLSEMIVGPDGKTYFCGNMTTEADTADAAQWSGWDEICSVPMGFEEMGMNRIGVYPQPSTGIFTIQLDAIHSNTFTAEVYDTFGKRVAQYRVNSPSFTIDLTEHEPGVYHLRFADVKGQGWRSALVRVE